MVRDTQTNTDRECIVWRDEVLQDLPGLSPAPPPVERLRVREFRDVNTQGFETVHSPPDLEVVVASIPLSATLHTWVYRGDLFISS